jgi:hypothetical protein
MAALIPTNGRSFVHVTLIIFDTQNEQQARGAYDTALQHSDSSQADRRMASCRRKGAGR